MAHRAMADPTLADVVSM
jgi:hypothetical protein